MEKVIKKILSNDNSLGNVLITGVVVMTMLSMFGLTLVARMVVDSNVSAMRVVGTKSYYLSEAGVNMGRRYLWLGNTADQTLGPVALGEGSFTVEIDATTARIYGSGFFDREDIYRITSTATVGPTSRQIEELRWRGGGNDKNFILYREDPQDEF